jgi:hypothetical protein
MPIPILWCKIGLVVSRFLFMNHSAFNPEFAGLSDRLTNAAVSNTQILAFLRKSDE